MTSSPRRTYARPKPARAPVLRRTLVILAALGVFATAIVLFARLSPTRLDPDAARASAAQSRQLYAADNFTAARDAAQAAVRSDPGSGEAHLALAEAELRLGDGLGAEGELGRATAAGTDPRMLHHLLGDAFLLQGDADKALAEAARTDPRYRADGLRVRARALTAKGDMPGANAALTEAQRIAPDDAGVWTDTGRFRVAIGDLSGAIAASQRAVQLDGGDIDALLLRGQMVRSQYGLVAALPWFEHALQRDPAYHDALIEYAATLGDSGRTVDMLAATRRALAARPGSPQALYLQAVLAARAGNYDLARSLVEKTGGAIDDLPGMLLLAGTLDIDSGDNEQAIENLRQLVATQPMNIEARKLLALALLRSDAARDAVQVLAPVVARADADSYALTLMARAQERLGDRVQAARLLDRAAYPGQGASAAFSADDSTAVLAAPAAERPDDPATVIPLVRALLAAGDQSGALARVQQVASSNPGAAGAQLLLGDMLMLQGRNGEAATAYQRAADLRYDEPTMLRLVEALDRSGRRGEAATALALFLSQNPDNVAALRLSGHWQLASGDFDAAIDTLEGLRARIGDQDAGLNADLSAAYAAAGQDEDAVRFGQAAYLLSPANPAAADAFGWALYQRGDNAGAVELLQKAVRLAPHHSGLRWHLAQVYAELNHKPEALAQAQAALADPGFAERDAAQALIGRLG